MGGYKTTMDSRKGSNADYDEMQHEQSNNNIVFPNFIGENKNNNVDLTENLKDNMSKRASVIGDEYGTENSSPINSPKNRSVRFYSSKAYNQDIVKKESILDKPEQKLTPLDKHNKRLQDHFVSLCDKNNQFAYHNSSLTKHQLKYHLSKK